MKSVSINGIARVKLGKAVAKQLRKEDNVPCVIYGGNEEPIHFYAHKNDFRKIIYTPNVYFVDINLGENKIRTIMGDIQFHPVTDDVLHIDFLRVFESKNVRVNLPISIIGSAEGVRQGGRLAQNMRRVLIEGLAEFIPENIEIDITNLKIGEAIRVSDLSRDNIKLLNNDNDVIIAIKTARTAILSEEEEQAESATVDTKADDAKEDVSSEDKS